MKKDQNFGSRKPSHVTSDIASSDMTPVVHMPSNIVNDTKDDETLVPKEERVVDLNFGNATVFG